MNLIIQGTRGHASVVADIAEAAGFTIVAFVDPFTDVRELRGRPVFGLADEARHLASNYFIAIGDNAVRARVAGEVEGFRFATLIHPTAVISKYASIGPGSVVMPRVVINANCVLGDHIVLNTGSTLDHDSQMENFSSLAPGVVTGGNVSIGMYTAINIGSVVRNGVSVGADTVIGAGAYLNSDMPNNVVAYGSPARVVRQRERGERYF